MNILMLIADNLQCCVCFYADVDECAPADGAAPCSSETEKCVNTIGTYRCDCANGFQRRSGKCEAKKKREL